MNQYQSDTNNYTVGNISLGEGRTESTIYPKGDCETGRTPVLKGQETSSMSYEGEQHVGDHQEYA